MTVRIEDIFTEAFEVFKANWVSLILATLVLTVGSAFIITGPPLLFGFFMMCLRAMKKEKTEVIDILQGFDYFLRSWGIFLGAAIAILVGLVLLVLPGIALLILLVYAMPLSIEKNLKALDSLKASYRLGRDNLEFTIILALITYAINAIGGWIVVGSILTIPFTTLCISAATIRLLENTSGVDVNH